MTPYRRRVAGAVLSIFSILFLSGCQTSGPRVPVIGEAFAGPAVLPLRKEISPKSPVTGNVRHGEKLQILQQHRHFVKVRTAQDAEGWVDERLLLDAAAITSLRQLSEDTKRYPSQGEATTYDVLNVHTEPNRLSPSYLQVQPGERVDVIGHKLAPKTAPSRKSIVLAPKAPRRIRDKKREKSSRVPPPAAPAAPKPPPDWIELSKERVPEPDPTPPPKAAEEPEAVIAPDDWTLIRNKASQSGWVLTRRIYMAIPDEVAQYAEGKRISSYFSLGKVEDEGKTKDIWLWTTIDSGIHPYDFDSFRVFVWSLHRHRYETAYIQRHLEGFFPVRAVPNGFSLVLLKEDGRRYRQSFSLAGNRVQFNGEQVE